MATRASADGAPTSNAACAPVLGAAWAACAKSTGAAAAGVGVAGRAGELRQSHPFGRGTLGRKAETVAAPPVEAARPLSRDSASRRAPTIMARTRPESRNRTSVLAG